MIIHGFDYCQIDNHKKTQNDKYKKAMEIINIFQENMKNGKETRVIVKKKTRICY